MGGTGVDEIGADPSCASFGVIESGVCDVFASQRLPSAAAHTEEDEDEHSS